MSADIKIPTFDFQDDIAITQMRPYCSKDTNLYIQFALTPHNKHTGYDCTFFSICALFTSSNLPNILIYRTTSYCVSSGSGIFGQLCFTACYGLSIQRANKSLAGHKIIQKCFSICISNCARPPQKINAQIFFNVLNML